MTLVWRGDECPARLDARHCVSRALNVVYARELTVTIPCDSAGFRLRGLDMTRIETFTDAAFAFALTLLVISIDPPTSMQARRGEARGLARVQTESGHLLWMSA